MFYHVFAMVCLLWVNSGDKNRDTIGISMGLQWYTMGICDYNIYIYTPGRPFVLEKNDTN